MWKLIVIFNPNFHQYVNLPFLTISFYVNVFYICTYFGLAMICLSLVRQKKLHTLLIYVCTGTFGLFLLWDAYIVGVMSPATAIVLISVIALGLLMFEAKVIYPILSVAILIIITIAHATLNGKLSYAPIFDFPGMHNSPYTNQFWCLSMLYFGLPVVTICFAMFSLFLHQWRHREASFRSLSLIDPLTKIHNRRNINQQLVHIAHKLEQQKQLCYGIIILDLDHFKRINDEYGHLVGDEVLTEVAASLQSNLRQTDILGRYGGEEFIILAKHADKNIIMQLAKRCQRSIQQLSIRTDQNKTINITASFGVTVVCHEQSMRQAIKQADDAMYQAKRLGRNLIVLSDETEGVVAIPAG
jgi:diguanylate cyclase (GGDEF)-like protein